MGKLKDLLIAEAEAKRIAELPKCSAYMCKNVADDDCHTAGGNALCDEHECSHGDCHICGETTDGGHPMDDDLFCCEKCEGDACVEYQEHLMEQAERYCYWNQVR